MIQKKQSEWHEQWKMLQDDELFLFKDWIYPLTLEDFKEKDSLECGCGGGQHTAYVAPFAKTHTAVDLNTTDLAQERNKDKSNIIYVEVDIAKMNLDKKYDIVFSIGVVHHTDSPDLTFENMKKHTKSGGKTVVWVYSKEGNWMVDKIVEPIRKKFLVNMSRKSLLLLSKIITACMYLPIYTIYLLPLSFLPFYEYFQNFRKLSFYRNTLNVFDKLNAPQVDFISKERISKWFNDNDFTDIHISAYKGVSWRGSGTKK
ncbi:MAG: class I SAM-dependent methyltransferase [Sphingobacteriaceae bacterium]|nr:class I SAM-dependent methyltransferase [Sphingobacteriaceae bacterium]